jgi:multidrug resistance efflux pump
MNAQSPAPIPIPLAQRWQDARERLVPFLVFGISLCVIGVLWRNHVAAPTLVGQAEPVLADVTSQKPGMLTSLNVVRFQKVKAGEPIGLVMLAEPRLLESSLAVIRAEIDMLRANMRPVAAQQRNALDYNHVRLDWMRQRAELAGVRVNLQLAETELCRTQELFKAKICSQRELDVATATQAGLKQQVEELARLVAEGDENFKLLQPTNTLEIAKISDDPLRAAIAVQESKLRLTEAELSPITLRASIDGIVTAIYRRSGEAVVAGQPIVALATLSPVRIVGYVSSPLRQEPKPGTRRSWRSGRKWRTFRPLCWAH